MTVTEANQNDMSDRNSTSLEYRDENGFLIAKFPYTWKIIEERVQNGQFIFGRSPDVVEAYKVRIDEIRREWESVDSYCQHSFLDYPFSIKKLPSREVKYIKDDAVSQSCPYRIVKNDFPYSLPPDVEHHTLWSCGLRPLSEYTSQLDATFPPNEYEVLAFDHPTQNKSVKLVVHYHVLVRKRSTQIIGSTPL